jgi:hypothetical protein
VRILCNWTVRCTVGRLFLFLDTEVGRGRAVAGTWLVTGRASCVRSAPAAIDALRQ